MPVVILEIGANSKTYKNIKFAKSKMKAAIV
jgi:hypothetical protein